MTNANTFMFQHQSGLVDAWYIEASNGWLCFGWVGENFIQILCNGAKIKIWTPNMNKLSHNSYHEIRNFLSRCEVYFNVKTGRKWWHIYNMIQTWSTLKGWTMLKLHVSHFITIIVSKASPYPLFIVWLNVL